MTAFLLAGLLALGGPTLYFAIRSREFRKFLAGAFFVSGGTQLYLCLANVLVPILGTDAVVTPAMSGLRSIVHLALFLVTLYFGYVREPGGSRT